MPRRPLPAALAQERAHGLPVSCAPPGTVHISVANPVRQGLQPGQRGDEGFFGLLKKEFWHGRDWSDWTPARFIEELGGWIGRYNTEGRSDALGGRTLAEFRSALGRAA